MMAAATFVHCNTAAALEAAAQKHPGWPLVVTGHSMGGKEKSVLCRYGARRQYNSHLRLASEPSQLLRLIGEDSGTHNSEEAVRAEEENASYQTMLGHFQRQQSTLPQGQMQSPQQGHSQVPQGSMQQAQDGVSEQPEPPQHASNPGSQAASMHRTDQQLGAQGNSAASVQQQR